jgi:manganese oxidase
MPTKEYEVIAYSIPIVYTLEGDHDPNGMAFVLGPVTKLLDWAKARWFDQDELLPRLHHKRQRAELVVAGLQRLDVMVKRLAEGRDEDRRLLAELIGKEMSGETATGTEGGAHGGRGTPRAAAVRTNVERQIGELQVALDDLGDHGLPHWYSEVEATLEAAEPVDALEPKPIRLVTLTSAQRHEWAEHWHIQGKLIERAIENWFIDLEGDPNRRFSAQRLNGESGIPRDWIKRLLLNDHQGNNGSGPYDRFNPMKPIPALRPLVLRVCKGDKVEIRFKNSLKSRPVGFFVQGECKSNSNGEGVYYADGSYLGENRDSRCHPEQTITFTIDAAHEGVWPINDLADVRGNEDGTNAHGLFGAFVVEPRGHRWRDPETGYDLTNRDWSSQMDVDVIPSQETPNPPAYIDFETDRRNGVKRSFREFTTFIHDEPEVHSGLHTVGEHSIMPLSYRAEPMHNRLPHRMRHYCEDTKKRPSLPPVGKVDRTAFKWDLGDELDEQFWTARTSEGEWLERVAGEEQHHSSWLFGEPITHIQRAYAGDPCRVQLVHAGVKETHIYHLHVHEWHAVSTNSATPSCHGSEAYDTDGRPKDKGSQLLDSITISPQSGMTIDPLFGSGSRQHAIGDIIWHCHLYPHFHHGMWGLWRSHDRLVDGSRAYPNGSYCPPLKPLPGRNPLPSTFATPGFPWFIDGVFPMKSPPPPAARDDQRNGRRILLKMPNASRHEKDAMASGCQSGASPGALFVDLDGLAAQWNAEAGLPPPRIVSYDIEMRADNVQYNVDGWHDPRTHRYRLMAVAIKEATGPDGAYQTVHQEVFDFVPGENAEPCFPRANHGDIVEWRHHNSVNSFPADEYDVGQLPVECGQHVHLVKFDVLSADGSATGWNYLSGASCSEAVGPDSPGEQRTVSLHRWVVDEEFGPCFFHDHLLANFRQKHGLSAALIAEPHGSQWHRADNQSVTAWGDPQAVIVPPVGSSLPPYREACLCISDFVPLLDKGGRSLNPPGKLSGDDDPGAMGVNYRSAPMTFRGKDPSGWFSSSENSQPNFAGKKGDPDTPIIQTYPGERLRIRLIQGSHEEQHGFAAHGLRWRRDWGHPDATLVNQQTLGISEAFTLDINPADSSAYSVGDHLWHFCAIDDIWLGCWGLVRALPPILSNFEKHAPLPDPKRSPPDARTYLRESAKPVVPSAAEKDKARTFVVVAERHEHRYAGDTLTDPWGLIYRNVRYSKAAENAARKKDIWTVPDREVDATETPLVLRAHPGEWVRLILVNNLIEDEDEDDGGIEFGPEPSPARLPIEHLDDLFRPDRRTVSSRVSIHPSLLTYDVRNYDGSYVGLNPDSTVGPRRSKGDHQAGHLGMGEGQQTVILRGDHHGRRNWREYWWYADPALAPARYQDGCGQVCYLHDMADIRNHRHHGLIGALIVEPKNIWPYRPGSRAYEPNGWAGLDAELRNRNGDVVAHEACWFVQDGLRFFVNGDPDLPMPDVNPTDDPEDSGQKGVNYRSHPVHRGVVAREGGSHCPEPIVEAKAGDTLWLRVIGGNDKPRQHSVVVHGACINQASWMGGNSPILGARSGISPGRVENLVVELSHKGDHAVRTGCFRWGSEHGIWATVRVK